MTRRAFGVFLILLAMALAVLAAPAAAGAQDADPDNPALQYPGPFGDSADSADDSTTDTTTDTTDAADEVLGVSTEASTGTQPISERSIDYLGDDNATRFIAPDLQLSTDGATGGTAGGTSGLAVTGSEVEPIIAISVGLLALGGSAVVSSRRRLRDFFV